MTTPDITGLCENLRNIDRCLEDDHYWVIMFATKAAETLERQAAEIERLNATCYFDSFMASERKVERQAAENKRLREALAEIPKTAKTLRIATSALVLAGKSEAAEMVTSVADGFEAIARAALTGEDTATLGLSDKTQTGADACTS